ncbi:MAG: hypothetical protein AB2A00_21905 [Myxococcota bacterium]
MTSLVVVLSSTAAHAGPRSQSGFAGAGGLLLVAEPTVDVVTVRASVLVRGIDADVSVVYGLKPRGASRTTQVAFPAAVRTVEMDGAKEPAPPWRNVQLLVDGTAVAHGTSVDRAPIPDAMCGDPPTGMTTGPARGHVVRGRVTLPAGKITLVELRFTTTMTHDDWRTPDGAWERSERRLCLRLRPLAGYQGQGMPLVDVEMRGEQRAVLAPGKRGEDGVWRYQALVVPSGGSGDFLVTLPPPG